MFGYAALRSLKSRQDTFFKERGLTMFFLADKTNNYLNQALDYSSLRQKVIADNIANVDTPNFKRTDVSFDAFFENSKAKLALAQTNQGHVPAKNFLEHSSLFTTANTRTRVDGNNVDIEFEMAKLASNSLYYETAAQLLSNRFQMLSKIIEQGGRSL